MKHWIGFLAALALLASACSDLNDIEDGVCGNVVLEPGEDCDGFADPALGSNLACVQPPAVNECRYACDPAVEGAECPVGWGCGTDGLCRRPGGELTRAPGSPWRFKVDEFSIGDVDGDGNADLIGSGDALITIRYGTETGEFPVDLDVATRRPQGPPRFADFDADGLLDVVMPIFSGIFVMLGQPDRTLLPVAYQPFALAVGEVDLNELGLVPLESNPEDLNTELLALVFNQQFFLVQAGDGDPLPFPDGHTVSDIVGRVPHTELDGPFELIRRQDWAFGFKGADRVYVYTSAGLGSGLVPALRQQVQLPAGFRVKYGVYFANVDGDNGWGIGSQDLLVAMTNGTRDAIGVAYNDGSGNLDLLATEEPVFEALTPEMRPLAIGDLNGDLRADYVSGDAIMMADFALIPTPGQPPRNMVPTALRTTELPWVDAAIGDFNGDETPDVAAAVEAQNGLDFYLGTGLLFNKFHVNTDDPPFALRVGDFDGDFVGDLAFGTSGLGAAPDGVAVAFGATSGGPVDPIYMGDFDFVRAMEPIQMIADIEAIDLITDLLVVSNEFPERDALSLAILQGNSDRRLLSPFSLTLREEDGGDTDVPQRVLIGNFQHLLPNDDPLDVVAVAQPPDNFGSSDAGGGTGPDNRVFRLWLVPSDGPGAQLSPQDMSYAEMPPEDDFETRCATWTAGDLDGDGLDEMLGIDGAFRCYGAGASPAPRVVVASAGDSGPQVTAYSLPGEFVAPAEAIATDLDADGDPDLLLLFRGEERSALGGLGGRASGSGLLVVWNKDGDLALGSASPLELPDANRVYGVAPILLRGEDYIPELVVLADNAIYLSTLDPATSQYGEPERLLDQQGEGRIAVGDVNGDGLDDLAWTEGSDAHVFLGVEGAPLGGVPGDAVQAGGGDQGGE